MDEKGGISVQTEHIFPVIKRWLYSDKDIFLREIVSNACDAVTKLKHLSSIGQAEGIGSDFAVYVRVDRDAGTITVSDNGIGMSAEEVKKYINQIALSGALDFIEKYEGNNEASNSGIIGHFGLGFYSAFMVADTVQIDTKSYTDAPAVLWKGTDEGDYEMTDSAKTDRGTDIIMHIAEDSKEYLDKDRVNRILEKYCAFMPVPVFYEYRAADAKDEAEKLRQINDTEPLWYKRPSDCTDEEYNELYRKLFNDYRDPLFHIHINADYPLNFKGILYFPRLGHEYESLEGQVKLYYNRVFVADNIKEVIPEYLLMLKGVLDCPELPLNVSRSYLQNSGYVQKISQHIVKKVCDKLVSLNDTQPNKYKQFWDDIKAFVEYACIRDRKFYDRVKDAVLFKTVDGEYLTLKEYADRTPEAEQDGVLRVYYASNVTQQTVYINMFKNEGMTVLVLDNLIDNNFITMLESIDNKVKFLRIDSNADALKKPEEHPEDDEGLKKLFADVSGNDKLKVEISCLKDEKIPALLNISEESRRFAEMMKLYGGPQAKDHEFEEDATLMLNSSNKLIGRLRDDCVSGQPSDIDVAIARQIYTLSLLGQRRLSAEELSAFLNDSFSLLERL